jgi:phosphatidylglycerol:prolipoprotein diacylglycerol transferase
MMLSAGAAPCPSDLKPAKGNLAPTLFQFGAFAVRGYGFMIALAIPLALLVMGWHAKKRGHGVLAARLPEAFLLSAFAAYLGGKLAFILGYPEEFQKLLADAGWAGVLKQGFVYYGALLLQIPAAVIFFRWLRVPFLAGLDSFVVGIPIMHAMGRVGCFLAGCCYGCRTDSPLQVTFQEGIGLNGVPLHPIQLYEALGNLLILGFLLFLSKRRPAPGTLTLAYFLGYALLRFFTEGLRGDGNPTYTGASQSHVLGNPPPGVTLSQWIALATAVVLVPILLLRLKGTPRKNA